MIDLYVKGSLLKERMMETLLDEQGLGTIEIAVIIIVLIGLALLFKGRITTLLNSLFDTMDTNVTGA